VLSTRSVTAGAPVDSEVDGAEGEPQTSTQASTQAVAPAIVHLRFTRTQGNGSSVVTPTLPGGVSLTAIVGR
jgi:hypothetical protein